MILRTPRPAMAAGRAVCFCLYLDPGLPRITRKTVQRIAYPDFFKGLH